MTPLETPQWTEQMYRTVGGQDHLGVGSVVTDRILPSLSPGINVLTPRPRYWSFYSFVIDEFWKRDLPRNNRTLRAFLRQKESIFSAAGHLCSGEDHRASPIGSRRVGPLVETNPARYRVDFDYMKSTGGGYGLYYGTTMQTTGAVRLADGALGLPVDTVTPEVGRELADAFRTSISSTQYWKKYFDADSVPADAVEEYGNVGCLCRLREDPPDRAPLVELLLRGGHDNDALARRTSLRMMLSLAEQSDGTGLAQDDFRRLVLYQSTHDPDTGVPLTSFDPPGDLVSVARRWRLSQLREMFNWSLNGMWRWISDWGLENDGDIFPIRRSDVQTAIVSASFSEVPAITVRPTDPIGDLIEQCRSLTTANDSLDGPWDLSAPLTEDRLFELHRRHELDPANELALLFVLYVTCLCRLWDPQLRASVERTDWQPVLEGGQLRIGMQFALDQLRRDAQRNRTVAEVMERIVNDHVIRQHERVALAKLPDDTFRFRREAGRLRFFDQSLGYQRNNSRFDALATTCAELTWCGFLQDESHPLTPEGNAICATGQLTDRAAP